MENTLKNRQEIAQTDRWNVERLYPSWEEWEKDFASVTESPTSPHWPTLATLQGKFKEKAENIQKALELSFSIARILEKIHTYAHLRHDEEITENKSKSAYQRITSLFYEFQKETAWIDPELLELPEEVVNKYLQFPALAPYRFHIEKIIRMRPHTLNGEKEELMAMADRAQQTSSKAFSSLNNADLKFGRIKDQTGKELDLTHGLYQTYLRSNDRVLRENAFKTIHGKFQEFENTLAELLSGQVQSHIFHARARSYPSSVEAAIFSKNIPVTVYRSLINNVREGLPSLHRYVRVRKKIMQLPELHLYDMYVPLVQHVDIRMNYEEGQQVVIDSVAPLGEEYQSILAKGLKEEGWVDRFENKNKRSGAYSSGCYDSSPYILMNFRGILRDTFTLAHEAGHSMHSYLSNKTQPYHSSHYPIFVAEVASTFNEELLMHLLQKRTTKKEERLFLINEKIEDIRGTLFRQTMFAEFELKIHELAEKQIPLTPTLLKELFYQLNVDYFGPEATIDPEIAIEWARIPHFYYNFYVYQYATGISAALSLAKKVLSGDQSARDGYLTFLKQGGSLFPIDLIKLAGVDMTTQAPIQAALRKFDSLVTELEKSVS